MRILDSRLTRASHSRGYTLLEILFVLVLIGLVGSLVVPRIDGLYDSVALSSEREDILNTLRGFPQRARQQGVPLDPDGESGRAILDERMAPGWAVTASDSLQYLPNGFCTGGQVQITHASGRRWTYPLQAPYCVPGEPLDG